MDIQESKVDATFQFGIYGEAMVRHPHQGLFQLFEHKYDDKLTFWYGMSEIACDPDEIHKFSQHPNVGAFFVEVKLADGRKGNASRCSMSVEYDPDGSGQATVWLGLVGHSELK